MQHTEFASSFHHHFIISSSFHHHHFTTSQPASQPVDNQLEGRSIATRLVPTQLPSNLRSRAMGWWVGLGSVGPKGAGWDQPGRYWPPFWLVVYWLAGWLAGCLINFATDLLLPWFKGLGTKRQKNDKKGTKKTTQPRKKLKFCMKNWKPSYNRGFWKTNSRPPTSPNF